MVQPAWRMGHTHQISPGRFAGVGKYSSDPGLPQAAGDRHGNRRLLSRGASRRNQRDLSACRKNGKYRLVACASLHGDQRRDQRRTDVANLHLRSGSAIDWRYSTPGKDVSGTACRSPPRIPMRSLINDCLRTMIGLGTLGLGLLLTIVQRVRVGTFVWCQRRLASKYQITSDTPVLKFGPELELLIERAADRAGKGALFAWTSGSTARPKHILYTKGRLRTVKLSYIDFIARCCWAL